MILLPHTAPLSFSWIFLFVCVHSSFDRLLIFGAVVVHPERRFWSVCAYFFSEVGLSVGNEKY